MQMLCVPYRGLSYKLLCMYNDLFHFYNYQTYKQGGIGGHLGKWPPSWFFKWPHGQICLVSQEGSSYQIWCLYHNLHDFITYLLHYWSFLLLNTGAYQPLPMTRRSDIFTRKSFINTTLLHPWDGYRLLRNVNREGSTWGHLYGIHLSQAWYWVHCDSSKFIVHPVYFPLSSYS